MTQQSLSVAAEASSAPSATSATSAPRSPTPSVAPLLAPSSANTRESSLDHLRHDRSTNGSHLSLDASINPRSSSLIRSVPSSIHSSGSSDDDHKDDNDEDDDKINISSTAVHVIEADALGAKMVKMDASTNQHSVDSPDHTTLSFSVDTSSNQGAATRYVNLGMSRPLSYIPNDQKFNPRGIRDPFNLPASLVGSATSMNGSTATSEKHNFFANPYSWDTMDGKEEPDDDLHDPNVQPEVTSGWFGSAVGKRGVLNIGVLALLSMGLVTLFGGYRSSRTFNDVTKVPRAATTLAVSMHLARLPAFQACALRSSTLTLPKMP